MKAKWEIQHSAAINNCLPNRKAQNVSATKYIAGILSVVSPGDNSMLCLWKSAVQNIQQDRSVSRKNQQTRCSKLLKLSGTAMRGFNMDISYLLRGCEG